MAMLDLQRRFAEVFRIRLGDRDSGRPRKLTDAIRITANGAQTCQAFADVYGGEVTPWEGQHQVYLPTSELRVVLLPGHSISQWWERYRGSVCERRCDGFAEQKSGKRCMCPEDVEARVADKDACSPTTRVNVLCPDVAVTGAGALVTHGLIAAETLPQSIAVAEAALSRGLMVPAVLRVVEHKGRNHFIVPQIEILGVSLHALATGDLQHATDTSPVRGLPPGPLTPVPTTLPTGPVPSVREQVLAVQEDPPRSARRNAQATVPATGLKPRTAAAARDDAPDLSDVEAALVEAKAAGVEVDDEAAKEFAGQSEGHAAKAAEKLRDRVAAAPAADEQVERISALSADLAELRVSAGAITKAVLTASEGVAVDDLDRRTADKVIEALHEWWLRVIENAADRAKAAS